ncbi:NADH-quinone oxidoreductase subunit C [Bacillus sp. DJP31]|uniref:NADH-quinone oxidoreductase subunit C n=1 Tax=Bacillus sp. DJP31 TaxID=3409789 RepID=UPI003BB65DA8
MSDEKSLDQVKREAAQKAKEEALLRLAERKAQQVSTIEVADSEPPTSTIEKTKEELKKEAAQKAKEAAQKRLADKQAEAAKTATEEPATEKTKEELKKEAAQKAKEAAQKRLADKQAAETESSDPSAQGDDLAKQKAIAVAKANAAAAAKAKIAALAKQSETTDSTDGDNLDDEAKAKAKAIAVAKAKAAAAAKVKAGALAKTDGTSPDGDDEKAKAIAAAKAKAAAAVAARAKAGSSSVEPMEEQKPSPNQPTLDKYVKVIQEHLGDVLEDSYINRLSKDVPTLVAKRENFHKVAEFLKYNEQLRFEYLSELHGTDFVKHMEVYVHLYSYKNHQSVALKVKIDRDEPVIDSLSLLWNGANWPEREAYDLLGIKFTGHPNLTRIMLTDDWVGYPLRKDYEPYDVEV